MGLQVKATKMVYYGLKRRKPGSKSELFVIKDESEFTPSCMEPVGWKTKEMKAAEAQAKKDEAAGISIPPPPPPPPGQVEGNDSGEEVI